MARLEAVHRDEARRARWEWRLDPHVAEDGCRHAAIDFFRAHDVAFELKAQVWADAGRQPIEDASVDWPISV
ncbi:catalase, partial [Methylobacterium sp. J-030]|nr:catalase [Methylobacterium sp. J-030]